uniref:Uncharacterized protein n=1 Tax=Arundo donax TaxID=35708 RepID=A0A0A9EVT2_ARUDO
MSFLHRGFLERPSSREKSVKVDDGLPFSNGNNSSSQSGLSPGFLTRHRRESAVISTSESSMHGLETRSDISMEQRSNAAAVVPDHIEERWSSDCTTNGLSFQLRSASDDRASDHLGENGHAILATKNTSCGHENGSNGTPM